MKKHKILLIGESCVDRFIYGECNRLNPEALTPVFIPKNITTNGGMGTNVKENLISLGQEPKFITNPKECIKTRYVDEQSNYILLRVDDDIKYEPLTKDDLGDLSLYDVVIVSDYDKGLINSKLLYDIAFDSKLTFIDTKRKLGNWSQHYDYIKLNKSEYRNNEEYILENNLLDKIIITLGGDGCRLGDRTISGEKVEVRDVVGAGDTFLSSLVVDFLNNDGDIYIKQ